MPCKTSVMFVTSHERGALLAVLRMKGQRPAEIVGFARTMREHAVRLPSQPGAVFDTCGTGGDGSGTFNISSAAALVVAVLLFVGANVVALVLMIGGRRADPAARELRH